MGSGVRERDPWEIWGDQAFPLSDVRWQDSCLWDLYFHLDNVFRDALVIFVVCFNFHSVGLCTLKSFSSLFRGFSLSLSFV